MNLFHQPLCHIAFYSRERHADFRQLAAVERVRDEVFAADISPLACPLLSIFLIVSKNTQFYRNVQKFIRCFLKNKY